MATKTVLPLLTLGPCSPERSWSAKVRGEPGKRARPRVRRGARVIRRALVAVKAVFGLGVANDLVRNRRLLVERRAQPLDVVDGNALVSIAEQSEPRALQRRALVDERWKLGEPPGHDAAAVEADRGAQWPAQRGKESDAAAEAEADDADGRIRESGVVQM